MIYVIRESLLLALRHRLIKRLAMGFAGSLALCLLASLLFWYPSWHETRSLQAQTGELEQQIKALRRTQQQSAAAVKAGTRLADIEQRLAQPASQATMMGAINTLSRKHKVKLVEQKSDQDGARIDGAEGFSITRHELLLSGRYADIRAWLRGLETLPGFVIVRHFHMERNKQGRSIRMTVKFDTIRRHDPGGQAV